MIQKKAEFLPNELDHPCKQTCSGWRQGYERGHQRFVNEDDSMWKAKYIAERDRASKEIAELEAALSMQGVDYGAAKEQMEKNYISAVSGRKEFRSLAVELRDQVSSLQSQLAVEQDRHATTIVNMSNLRNELQAKLEAAEKRSSIDAEINRNLANRNWDLNAKLEKVTAALRKIAEEDDDNSNFTKSEDEAQYYIDTAKQALAEMEKK